jgi:hypothetical protein
MTFLNIPETAQTWAAREVLTQLKVGDILRMRLGPALMVWALEKMGSDRPKYLEAATWNFYLLLILAFAQDLQSDPEAVIERTPFRIPLSVPKRGFLPHRVPGKGFLTPQRLLQDFVQILSHVQNIKAKLFRNRAAFALALKETLPGLEIPAAKVAQYHGRTKPYDIALDLLEHNYRVHNYKLPVGVASLKKAIHLARNPGKIAQRAVRDLERHYGGPLQPPPVKRPSK